MGRWQGTTTERGYGWEHAKLRKRWKPYVDAGQVSCHAPICLEVDRRIPPGAAWTLGHTEDRSGWTGPEHQRCGAADGARRGNQARQFTLASATTAGSHVTCKTCGQRYTRAARVCEICGAHYHPSRGDQRTCGRACGMELRRRNHGPSMTSKPPKPRPQCQTCGKPCNDLGRQFCSATCANENPDRMWPSSSIYPYTCRYCGKSDVAHGSGAHKREVCPDRACQLARLASNNLVARNGVTKEDADAHVTRVVAEGLSSHMYGRWATSRRW